MNNEVNDTTNPTIPGVKVAMPSDKPVDATTTDAGAAVSKAQQVNNQVFATNPAVVAPSQPAAPVLQQTTQLVQPVASVASGAVQTVPSVQPVVPAAQQSPTPAVVAAQPVQVSTPVFPSGTPTQPVTMAQPIVEGTQSIVEENPEGRKKKEKRPKNKLARFFFFIIILLCVACTFLWYYHQQQMAMMNIKCTPVSTSGETKELDLNSTIVKDLYGKVSTTIREDLGALELTDEMKLYLAYRQIATSDVYESNCNKFNATSMEPFTCESTVTFVPVAFKAEVLQVELKKLFGEDTNIANQNIQLGNTCIGGFQYIEERGEYVQGQCSSTGATLYRVEKELIGATSTESTIVLTEKVKYYGAESLELPTRLVSGTYRYTFKLDMNYNYIYVSKELVS